MRRGLLALLLLATACRGDGKATADAGPDGDGGGLPPDAGMQPDGGEPSAVVTCPDPVPAAANGVCDVSGSGGQILVHGGAVLGASTVYENGYVLIDGDSISCVGCDCDDQASGARVVTCAEAVVSPGLFNAHNHAKFEEQAPFPPSPTRYEQRQDWRDALSTPGNPNGTSQSTAGMRWAELRQALGGATTMLTSGRALGLIRNMADLETGESARGLAQVDWEVFPLGDQNGTFRADCTWNYDRDERRVAQEPAFLPHVAEGINNYAAEEFRCQSTSFDGGQDFTEKNTAHMHSIALQAADYYKMALEGTEIIWSPRSNISLYGHTAQVTTFDNVGGTIALGTDWTYSGSNNLLRELACADSYNRDYLDGHFTAEELWKMATINGAIAAGADDKLGSLESGKLADVAVFAGTPGDHHRAVLDANTEDLALLIKAGSILLGEADTLTALGESCEAVDVCGKSHAICAQREFGASYNAIATEVSGSYPVIHCGVPTNEPTCVPSRPGEFDGSRGGGDADGDGIADGSDNCPNVFNPVRPIDGGNQPDADGDGMGDPCDPQPLAADLDGDSVNNTADNCPFDANQNQADGDGDNKGDTCDPCPSTSNPTSVCPVQGVKISDIQMGTIGQGADVAINGVVVTSTFSSGCTVQDPAASSPEYSGVYVYTGSNPGVAVGDLVNVTGKVTEFHNMTEIEFAMVTKVGTGTAITPVDITVADANTEPYEGVLVRVTNVTSVDATWDCTVDDANCTDTDVWQANQSGPAASVLVHDWAYQDNDWASQIGVGNVTGVISYRFMRFRLMPRTAADFN